MAVYHYEVREFSGAIRYSGDNDLDADTMYKKLEALQTPVVLLKIEQLAITAEYEQQRKARAQAIPWAR